jgi:hypothetical protein
MQRRIQERSRLQRATLNRDSQVQRGRLKDDAQCQLVIIGATPEGKKEPLPSDLAAAHAMIIVQRDALMEADARASSAESEAQYRALLIEKLNTRSGSYGGDQDFVGPAGDASGPLELVDQEFPQRAIAKRAAFEAIGRKRRLPTGSPTPTNTIGMFPELRSAASCRPRLREKTRSLSMMRFARAYCCWGRGSTARGQRGSSPSPYRPAGENRTFALLSTPSIVKRRLRDLPVRGAADDRPISRYCARFGGRSVAGRGWRCRPNRTVADNKSGCRVASGLCSDCSSFCAGNFGRSPDQYR